MRHRVTLAPPPDSPAPAAGEVREALSEIPWLLPDKPGTFRYRSDATGVVFAVRAGEEGLVAELPLAVPSFYGREAFLRLAELAGLLSLRFVPPDPEVPEWSGEEAALAWAGANREAAVREWRSQRGDRPWLPEERLLAWWGHQRSLRDTEEREGLLAPPVTILLDKETGEVRFGAAWPDLAPRLLPRVDLLLATWTQVFEKRGGGVLKLGRATRVAKEVGGYARMADLDPFFAAHATEVDGPLPLYRYEGDGDARRAVGAIPLIRKERLQILDPSQVVDHRPERPKRGERSPPA